MNLKTVVLSSKIPRENYIVVPHISHEHPTLDMFQVIETNCANCNYKMNVPVPHEMVNQADLIKELGKRVNELRVKLLVTEKELCSLKKADQ